MGGKLLEYILVVIVKAILGVILDRVSPPVKKAMLEGMDKAKADNKVDEAVLGVFGQHWTADRPYDQSLDGGGA